MNNYNWITIRQAIMEGWDDSSDCWFLRHGVVDGAYSLGYVKYLAGSGDLFISYDTKICRALKPEVPSNE